MKVLSRIKRILRYARPMILVHGGGDGVTIKAILQPMRYKNKMYLDSQNTKLGIIDESSFLFITSAEVQIDEMQDMLVMDDAQYVFVKVEKIYCFNTHAYTWAILRRRS